MTPGERLGGWIGDAQDVTTLRHSLRHVSALVIRGEYYPCLTQISQKDQELPEHGLIIDSLCCCSLIPGFEHYKLEHVVK